MAGRTTHPSNVTIPVADTPIIIVTAVALVGSTKTTNVTIRAALHAAKHSLNEQGPNTHIANEPSPSYHFGAETAEKTATLRQGLLQPV